MMRPTGPRVATAVLAATVCLLLCSPAPALAVSPPAPRIVSFSPQGSVKQVRQVRARFSEPMVPLGDPRPAVAPFEIACPEAGTGRWIASGEWAYDFDRDLPAGLRCTFRLRPGLATLAGIPVEGQPEFTFSTGGPAVKAVIPQAGASGIDEEQAFLLRLDAEPTEASIRDHVRLKVASLPESLAVRVVTGEARQQILKAEYFEEGDEPIVVLQAVRPFPNEARVTLIWGKGVASKSGVATERDQTFAFQVRKQFTAQFTCERENPRAGCIPVTPMRVTFSAPVLWETAKQIVLVGPDQRRWSPAPPKAPELTVQQVRFVGPFPEQTSFRVILPPGLKDDAGRQLTNAGRFPLAVRTEAFPPLAKFAGRFGILERSDPVLPVTLRNLEPEVRAQLMRADPKPTAGPVGALHDWLDRMKGRVWRVPPERSRDVVPWLRRVEAASRERSIFGEESRKEFSVPKPAGAKPFEVIGIPLDGPGLYVVELESAKLGAALLDPPRPMYVHTAALVTNLAVHFKWGGEQSLAWVTALDTGRPVAGARVSVQDCAGKVLWDGETDQSGIARIAGLPKGWQAVPRCEHAGAVETFIERHPSAQSEALHGLDGGLFVFAQTRDDLSFVHSSWDRGIEPWRFRLPQDDFLGPYGVHTIFDRSLLRAGETVHMKHVLRKQTLGGFALPAESDRPKTITVQHLGSDQKYTLPVQWDAQGLAETTWTIPKEAKLGSYQVLVQLPTRWSAGEERVSGGFRVEEFRLALTRGIVKLPAEPQVAATEMPVDVSVSYLAGGAARDLPVTVRAVLQPKEIPPIEGFEDFAFATGPVAEGVTGRQQESMGGESDRDSEADGESAADGAPRERLAARPPVHQREQVTLDAGGTARVTIARLPRVTTPQELLAEMEYPDPNGELRTVAGRVPLWPARWLAGIQPDAWVASKERLKAWVAAVDVSRRPVANAPVRVAVFERKYYSHRKRLVGGFYAYEHVEEVKRLGELCAGRTDARGRFLCEGPAPGAGNLLLEATVTDPEGNGNATHGEVWVPGPEAWWFPVEDSDRMDVLPEKRKHEPGETARVQVRMPFREATALVTVEREGVLEAFVTRLAGTEPVVEVPVKPEYAPNVFISVLAVRGRVGDAPPTALVDLAKPAFKLGIGEIWVGWRAHELKVAVTPDRSVYRVREKARVRVSVRTADGKVPPRGSEIAVAAVDEGLLELMPNRSWNLLEPMMRRRGYGVETATAQMQVVGKRHYGLKALPQGGGGGRQVTRELFDTLLLWKGRVPLDARGEANVEIPLNDALTSFRIVAVATGGASLFGTGSSTIRSTQDLMLLAGLPPLVREGDRFPAEVTVRNTTSRGMDLQVEARIEGTAAKLEPRRLHVAGGQAGSVRWDIAVPVGAAALRYDIQAGEPGGAADRVRVTQQVVAAVPVRTLQATLLQLDQPRQEAIERPADALLDRGGIQAVLSPSLAAGVQSVQEWMRRYPYTCLEQRVSRLVALRDLKGWEALAAGLPAYQDADGLLKYFPEMREGSDVLTAYVLAIAHESGWGIPGDIRTSLQKALERFVSGGLIRGSAVPAADLPLRKLAAVEALSRYGVASPHLLDSVTVEPNLWPTSAILDWWSILHRIPGMSKRDARRHEAEQIIKARLNVQGTTMGFSSDASDMLWWLMRSPDQNAVRLVLHLLATGEWRDELPRLMRGAIGRQRHGAWDLTVANAWGVLAIEKFAAAFERHPVTGTTTATLGGATKRLEWGQSAAGGPLGFAWPAGRSELALSHAGAGAPWVMVQAQAAVPLQTPLSSGYRIARTVMPIEQRVPGRWSRGDVLRVRLSVEAQGDMAWVVFDDPIPAGASHLGTGLGGDSLIGAAGEQRKGCACFAFAERRFDSFRAYYEFVPKGTSVVEYTIRLNQPGRFQLPTTRVEALYAPEMFGEAPNAAFEVQP
jgi:alpha-2-macroglobulin